MEQVKNAPITISTFVNAPIEKVWSCWNEPDHITKWAFASDEWHSPRATNDLRTGGTFITRMEAKDGSMGFDFGGVYDSVDPHKHLHYTIGDGRKVQVEFTTRENGTEVVEVFEPEGTHPIEMQRAGWQAILDNFRKYTEGQ